ncbi:MAG: hypothetical protein JXA43_02100 [Candidatus Diapherotrites archaeon]|nr:hypothetical protein [Candidatus Diapherotrites archaeon]
MMGIDKVDERIQKICAECTELGANAWVVAKMADALEEYPSNNLSKMKKRAVTVLEKLDPEIASAYSALSRIQIRRSDQRVEEFDKQRIVRSLLDETTISRGMAEKIGKEVETEIKTLNTKIANSIMIRELVNTKLLQYGFENLHSDYTRIGLPVSDLQKRMMKASDPETFKDEVADYVISQYTLLKILPSKIVDAHLSGNIHISSITSFPTKIYSYAPKPDGKTFSDKIRRIMEITKICVAPPILSDYKEWVTTNSHSELLSSFTPTVICTDLESKDIIPVDNAQIKIRKGKKKETLDFIEESGIQGLFIINSNVLVQSGVSFINKTLEEGGIFEKVVINLPKIATDTRGNETRFMKKIEDVLSVAQRCSEIKEEVFLGRKDQFSLNTDALYNSLGLFGIEEAVRIISDGDILSRSGGKTCRTIFKGIQDLLPENWIIEESGSEASKRFSQINDDLEIRPTSGKGDFQTATLLDGLYTGGNALEVNSLEELGNALSNVEIRQIRFRAISA